LNICIQGLLLFSLILLPYLSSFDASWHLDDYANITWNPKIKIERLTIESLNQAMRANPGKQDASLYRPLPMLTFALNWYLGKDKVFGYHAVNWMFHWVSATFLFFTVLTLYQSPRLREQPPERALFGAWLTAALWAINPIQTQAVTYIVQRMASMAACFGIVCIFFYVKGRVAGRFDYRFLYFSASALSLLAALGSKENAVTIPPALFFIECVFFQDLSRPQTRRRIFLAGAAVGITVIVAAGMWFLQGNPFSILKGYANREFTVSQRLMTQPRVLVFHLSQIFYPIPSRFSIVHDIQISRSLMDPWTTGACLTMILALVAASLLTIRTHPLLSFAIGFFLINHLVESTILPLEMIFEHRNYLPSMFLFLPVAEGLHRLCQHYRNRNRILNTMIPVFATALLIGSGVGTYSRNMVWASEKTLWEDAILKAPGSSRAFHNLAWGHYEGIGDMQTARALYLKALTLNDDSLVGDAATYNNLAIIYFNSGNRREALSLWKKAIGKFPKYGKLYYQISDALIKMGEYRGAEKYMDILMAHVPDKVPYLNQKGLILLKTGKARGALEVFRKSLSLSPGHNDTWVYIGECLAMLENHRNAHWFFRGASNRSPGDPYILLWLAATRLSREGEKNKDVTRFVNAVGTERVVSYIEEISDRPDMSLPSMTLMVPAIIADLKSRAQRFAAVEASLDSMRKSRSLPSAGGHP
jgi:tetratricopeptide (TPR) repeat protein